MLKTIILPRQARDKHTVQYEKLKNRERETRVFLQALLSSPLDDAEYAVDKPRAVSGSNQVSSEQKGALHPGAADRAVLRGAPKPALLNPGAQQARNPAPPVPLHGPRPRWRT